ncbi:hypothetical protein T492DRAFT_846137 [Pavlovales sp. CCMP2436]|nr:hypothetical protein T492DRAFT_846137 [Pavlovales sp. CCMP2436]
MAMAMAVRRPPLRSLRLLSVAFALGARAVRTGAGTGAGAELIPLFNKGVYDSAVKCSRLGWFARRRQYRKPPSSSGAFLAEQGQAFELHVLAHAELAPNTIEMPPNLRAADAAAETRARMLEAVRDWAATGETTAIFQPTFLDGDVVARADAIVLAPLACPPPADDALALMAAQWDVLEVKSVIASNAGGKSADLAFTVRTAEACGARVRSAMLYAVNSEYRLETRDSVPLYAPVDLTVAVRELIARVLEPSAEAVVAAAEAKANARAEAGGGRAGSQTGRPVREAQTEGEGADEGADEVDSLSLLEVRSLTVADLERVTAGAETPAAVPVLVCKNCPAAPDCTAKGISHPLWELPRVGQKLFEALVAASPSLEVARADPAELSPAQRLFHAAVLRGDGAPVRVDDPPQVRRVLGGLRLPLYYLDFEATGLLFPPFEGIAPYKTLLTQYSLHVVDDTHVARAGGDVGAALGEACVALAADARAPGPVARHCEYLAEGMRDCREELALRLLDDLDQSGSELESGGSILVYSSYEATQLKGLARDFPHLADRVLAAKSRLVDLEPLVRKAISHAMFRGRSSLKIALPTLVPALADAYGADVIGDGSAAAAAFARLADPALPLEQAEVLRTQLLVYCALDTRAMVELHRSIILLLSSCEEAHTPSSAGRAGAEPQPDAIAPPPSSSTGGSSAPPVDVDRMLVRELKEELRRLGLPLAGNKADLSARLRIAITMSEARGS